MRHADRGGGVRSPSRLPMQGVIPYQSGRLNFTVNAPPALTITTHRYPRG